MRMTDDWSKYEALCDDGWSPQALWRYSKSDTLDWAERVRMIRSVYGLSLAEAKEVKLRAEGIDMSLDEYQSKVILPALEEAERQGLFDDHA